MSQEELLARNKETLGLLSKENRKYKQKKDIVVTKVKGVSLSS